MSLIGRIAAKVDYRFGRRGRTVAGDAAMQAGLTPGVLDGTQMDESADIMDFQFAKIRTHDEYLDYEKKVEPVRKKRMQLEKTLAISGEPFRFRGYNELIERYVDFCVDFSYSYLEFEGVRLPNYRERCVCAMTGLNNRMRGGLQVIKAMGCWKVLLEGAVYATERVTPFFDYIHGLNPRAIGSEFMGDAVPLGEKRRGARNEDVTRLTFADGSFDLVITNDVLEHVPEYPRAYGEMVRVLKEGGCALITIPFDRGKYDHTIRAVRREDGSVEHLLPPQYHGDPMNADGQILCFQVFGWKVLDDLKAAGFREAAVVFYWSYFHGFLGQDLMVIFATR